MDINLVVSQYCLENPDTSVRSLAAKILEETDIAVSFNTVRRHINKFRESQAEEKKLQPTSGDLEYDKSYVYQSDKDLYIFFIPGYNKPLSFAGDKIRELKRRYSNWDGSPNSINQICRAFKLSRSLFDKIRRILSWTHDSEPFTDEELVNRSEEDLLSELVQGKKFALEQRFEQQKLQSLEKDARKWRELKLGALNPFTDYFESHQDSLKATPTINLTQVEGEYACVISPFDLHFGKYGWDKEVGETYNRKIAEELLLEHTQDLLSEINHYPIEKFIVPVGSDYFHFDTVRGTTTNGTPQDCDGTLVQIMFEGSYLMIKFIDMLRQVAPVEIPMAAGNHDRVLSNSLLLFLQGYYREASNVAVTSNLSMRQYVQYGNTVMGFTHGDGPKMSALPGIMVNESGLTFGPDTNKVWFTGHLHFEKVVEMQKTKIYQMPSLSGTDRWHHLKGYKSVRGMCAYLVTKDKGVRHNIFSNI
jgi:hypothetical protein